MAKRPGPGSMRTGATAALKGALPRWPDEEASMVSPQHRTIIL